MKKIILICILPFVLSLFALRFSVFNSSINTLISKENKANPCPPASSFINNFQENPWFENIFLHPQIAENTIYLLGSSELTEGGNAIPYTFIPKHFKNIQVHGFGHAGNQCLSIFSQLLANSSRLANSKIVFIISPGWFESKPTKGTSSEIFLEYNSENFLNKILENNNEDDAIFKTYAHKRVADLYSEFNSPNLPLKLMNFEHCNSKSIVHKAVFIPIIFCDKYLLSEKKKLVSIPKGVCLPSQNENENTIEIILPINWDSLLNYSKQEVLKKVTNNDIGIEDSYYSEFIKDKRGKIEPVKESLNTELDDFKMLIRLAKQKQVQASFIISPLNPFYFKNISDIEPTMEIIKNEITTNGFTYLNLLETNPDKYEKAILHDVMHMSDFGWYLANKYIIETYGLMNQNKITNQ